jgi:hypothetical protein
VEVVDEDESAFVLDTGEDLVELEAHQPPSSPSLTDRVLDLVGDAQHHLGSLSRITTSPMVTASSTSSADSSVATSSRRAGTSLRRLQRLVGPVEQTGDRYELVLLVAGVTA